MSKPSPENPIQPVDIQPEKQEREKFEVGVRQAVAQAYQAVSLEYRDRLMDPNPAEIYWQPMCQEFSENLHARLLSLNAQPKYVYINKLPKNFQRNFRHHIFLAAKSPDGEDYFVDGTWQQFAEKPDKKTGLLFEPAPQVLNSPVGRSAPKEIKELWEIGLCMLESKKIINNADNASKIRIKNEALADLGITEKDFDSFVNLKSNFGIELARKILELLKINK